MAQCSSARYRLGRHHICCVAVNPHSDSWNDAAISLPLVYFGLSFDSGPQVLPCQSVPNRRQ
ncbi:hypothetical protein PISMIDRAFT_669872 [Pisolithus microcarpus 441]|uniref:Uncharacterized protein n=1 Tax=Pisolithus microcarpus 441 TaxID=765257 RepID=A0A0C9ZY36_9AGAM|nr:hypothetical protein PISMIDRAFT_669872 [Pisolithus microcarpus 441]